MPIANFVCSALQTSIGPSRSKIDVPQLKLPRSGAAYRRQRILSSGRLGPDCNVVDSRTVRTPSRRLEAKHLDGLRELAVEGMRRLKGARTFRSAGCDNCLQRSTMSGQAKTSIVLPTGCGPMGHASRADPRAGRRMGTR